MSDVSRETGPRKISVEDTALALLEAALMAFAAVEDLYIPRKHELAQALYHRAVEPLLADLGVKDWPADRSCGNSRHCSMGQAHDTHIWEWMPDPADPDVTIDVRCSGRAL